MSADEKRFSFDRVKEIYRTANSEHKGASLAKRTVLGSTLAGLAFEWSSGNESMLGFVSGQTYAHTHNPLLTSLAAGGASFAEQSAVGALMAITVHNYPEVTAKIREIATGDDHDGGTFMGRYAGAMILGAGVEVAKENALRPHEKKDNMRRAIGNAAIIAISNTMLVGGLSGLVRLGEEHGFETASETVVDVASNPLTYAALIGGVIGYGRLKKVFAKQRVSHKRKQRNNDRSEKLQKDVNADSDTHVWRTQEILHTDEGVTVTVGTSIPEEDHSLLWDMVETGFQDLNQRSYEKQDMTRQELEADLRSDHVLKYIARDAESTPIGLLTVHVGVEDVTWIDASRIEKKQKEVDPDAEPYYVGTIVVPIDERGTGAAANLLRGAFRHFKQANVEKGQNSLVFFDCAHANYPWLGEFIQEIGTPTDACPDVSGKVEELYTSVWLKDGDDIRNVDEPPQDLTGEVLDTQHFYCVSITK